MKLSWSAFSISKASSLWRKQKENTIVRSEDMPTGTIPGDDISNFQRVACECLSGKYQTFIIIAAGAEPGSDVDIVGVGGAIQCLGLLEWGRMKIRKQMR